MQQLLAKKYEIKTQRIGDGKLKDGTMKKKEGQVLNRVVRRTASGWELEADLRHAELIIKQLGLESANAVSTPGVAQVGSRPNDEDDADELLGPADASLYRAIIARCNYYQPDRPNMQFAVKEACRLMSSPTVTALDISKIIGRR